MDSVSREGRGLARAAARITLAMQLARDVRPDDGELVANALECAEEVLCDLREGVLAVQALFGDPDLSEWTAEMYEWRERGGFRFGPPPVPYRNGEGPAVTFEGSLPPPAPSRPAQPTRQDGS